MFLLFLPAARAEERRKTKQASFPTFFFSLPPLSHRGRARRRSGSRYRRQCFGLFSLLIFCYHFAFSFPYPGCIHRQKRVSRFSRGRECLGLPTVSTEKHGGESIDDRLVLILRSLEPRASERAGMAWHGIAGFDRSKAAGSLHIHIHLRSLFLPRERQAEKRLSGRLLRC